jgi:hypothetical protein
MKQNPENSRFRDSGATIWEFLDRFFVHCPKCDGKAEITKVTPGIFGEVRLACITCRFSRVGKEVSYNMEVKADCTFCHGRIEHFAENVKVKKTALKVRCPHCHKADTYQPVYLEQKRTFNAGGPGTDPFLGLPLWLRADIGENTLWAYNYEHLAQIKGYVGAKLRTRSGRNITSMLEKLPGWIKSAKNRVDLMRLIEELERK